MEIIVKMMLILLLVFPVAGFPGEHCPPSTPPSATENNVSDGGSNHNALALAAIIGIGICLYHKCWQPKPVKTEASLVPDPPINEYLRIRKQ